MAKQGEWGYGAKDMARDQAEEARRRGVPFQASAPSFDRQDFSQPISNAQRGMQRESTVGRDQAALAQALRQRAEGRGPSLAEMQLRRSTDQNVAAQQGMLASQRGINPAAAMRTAAYGGAAAQQGMAGQAAQLRAQEQLAAQQALGAHLAGMRGQDISQQGLYGQMFGTAAGLQHQQSALGVQSDLQAQGINAQMHAQAMADQRARDALQVQTQFQDEQRLWDMTGQVVGGLAGGAGGAITQWALPGKFNGGQIPGRATRPGDHPANDTVLTRLSPGEVVLPRSVAQAEDAPERARKFIEAIQGRQKKGAR